MSQIRWTPDTHNCVVIYNLTEDGDEMVQTVVSFLNYPTGDRFNNLSDQAIFDLISLENQAASQAVNQVINNHPEFLVDGAFEPSKFPVKTINDEGITVTMHDDHKLNSEQANTYSQAVEAQTGLLVTFN